jgi:UDP-glucuronate decarboxylase
MRRVLITGGAGFLGSHLCSRLVADDYHVICLDNFSTGHPDNVAQLRTGPHAHRFELVRHDVVDRYYAEVDQIYHLACPASPGHDQRSPVRTLKTAVLGTMNMLELAQATGARVLIASTSEIYGEPEVHPQREDYWGHVNSIGKRACYDEGKRCGEALAVAFREQHGVDARIARIFLMARLRDPGPVNLGNPEELTVRQIAELVRDLSGSTSVLEYRPLPADDPTRRRPDISKARRALGWEPLVSAVEGLARTIEYFRGVLPACASNGRASAARAPVAAPAD